MAAENSFPKVSNMGERMEEGANTLSTSTRTVVVKRAGIVMEHQTRCGESLHPATLRAGAITKVVAAKHTSAVPIKSTVDKKYTNPAVWELALRAKDVVGRANALIAHAIDNNDMSSLEEIITIHKMNIDDSFRGITHIVRMILNKNVDMVKKYDNVDSSSKNKHCMYKLRVAIGVGCIDIVKYYYYSLSSAYTGVHRHNIFRRAIHDGQVEIVEWAYSLGFRINSLELPIYADTTAEIKKWMYSKSDLIVTDALMPVLQ